jgi:iron-sulfur cluster assembly protein
MLTLTENASDAIRRLVDDSPEPDHGGMRIAPGPSTAEGTALELSLVEEPEPKDETVEDAGATVYLEQHIAPFLDDKVLDAQFEEGRVTFVIRDETPGSPPEYGHPNGSSG